MDGERGGGRGSGACASAGVAAQTGRDAKSGGAATGLTCLAWPTNNIFFRVLVCAPYAQLQMHANSHKVHPPLSLARTFHPPLAA